MKIGVNAAVLAALSMASLGIFSRKIPLPTEIIIFSRMSLGAFFLLIFILYSKNISELCKLPTINLISSGFFLAAFALCYFYGLTMTTMANAVIILYLAPLISVIFAHFFLKERLTVTTFFYIVLALLGFAMVMQFRFDFSADGKKGLGIFSSLLSMFFYASFIINNRIIDNITVYHKTFYQLFFASLFLLPFAVYKMGNITIPSVELWSTWLWLAAVGVIPGFIGVFFVVLALERLPTVTFGTLSYLEPIFVILFGWFLFAEKLSLLQITGCFLIIISGIATGILATQKTADASK